MEIVINSHIFRRNKDRILSSTKNGQNCLKY